MGDKLAVRFLVQIGGRTYRNWAEEGEQTLPKKLEVEHRDNEASRLTLVVKDFNTDADRPFPEFNATPDPVCNPNVEVQAWAGWDGEELIKVFAGLLVAKKPKYPAGETTFVAIHDAFKLRKRGKPDAVKNLTVAQLLKRKAAEEGIDLVIDGSAAGDEALHAPAELFLQGVKGLETNWDLMYHLIRSFGYVTTSVKKNVLVLRVDKSGGKTIPIVRGDGKLINFEGRYEQKREGRSPRGKGHTYDQKPSRHQHKEHGQDCGQGRKHIAVQPALPKRAKDRHRDFFARASVKQIERRLGLEGRELTFILRFEPTMRNEEVLPLSGYGPQLDKLWHTGAVTHSIGNTTGKTTAACWAKQ